MSEMKPCPLPWCMGEAVADPSYFVSCDSCGTHPPECDTEGEALALWNTRPEEARLSSRLEEANLALSAFANVGRQICEQLPTGRVTPEAHANLLAQVKRYDFLRKEEREDG